MIATQRQRMTMAAFLAWEERQEPRFEYDGYGPVAIPDSTVGHAALSGNLIVALASRLRGTAFGVLGVSMKVLVAGHVRYPDAVVFRLPVAPKTTVPTEPLVMFEIASPETHATDHIVKNLECGNTPSVQRYTILERDMPCATMWSREADRWFGRLVTDDLLSMPEIGIEIPLAELYEGVTFEDPNASP